MGAFHSWKKTTRGTLTDTYNIVKDVSTNSHKKIKDLDQAGKPCQTRYVITSIKMANECSIIKVPFKKPICSGSVCNMLYCLL